MKTVPAKPQVLVAKTPTELAAILGLEPSAAVQWGLRSGLTDKSVKAIVISRKTHAEVAKLGGTSRTRVTAIVNRNTGDISTDLMLRMLAALGYEARLTFRRIPAA